MNGNPLLRKAKVLCDFILIYTSLIELYSFMKKKMLTELKTDCCRNDMSVAINNLLCEKVCDLKTIKEGNYLVRQVIMLKAC